MCRLQIGYDRFSRYEVGENHSLIDVAQDFPFARAAQTSCLKSVSSRAIDALFSRYLFRIAIALHGKNEFVGYSWGSDTPEFCKRPRVNSTNPDALRSQTSSSRPLAASGPHRHTKPQPVMHQIQVDDYDDDEPDCTTGWTSPDASMMGQIAEKMAAFAGPLDTGKPYKTGALNNPEIAAPVTGGFADYAYASSFRPDLVSMCGGAIPSPSNVSHRAATFLFETNKLAMPPERSLGASHNLYRINSDVIPRLLRPLLLAVDIARPYVFFTPSRRPRVDRGGVLRAQWSVGGALTVDRTYLLVRIGSDGEPFSSSNQSGSSMWGQHFDAGQQGLSIFERLRRRRRLDRFIYDDSVLLYRHLTPQEREHGTRLIVQAVAEVDSEWGATPVNETGNGRGATFPQSHLARSRTDRSWKVRHGGASIGYEGVAFSEAVTVTVPPLSGWLVWRDLAILFIILCMLPPALLVSCARRGARIAPVTPSRSLARLRLRQWRKTHGWLRNSKREIAADIAEIQRLRSGRGV